MALTGLDIYKLLPRTNCGECGSPTCLAFAMKLSAKQANLDACPYVSEAGKAALGAASRPPIRLVNIGTGESRVELGSETVLFRHEDTFVHETAFALLVREDDPERTRRLDAISRLRFERVGNPLRLNLIALRETSGKPESYAAFAAEAARTSSLALMLWSESPECLRAALEKVGDRKPLLYPATESNHAALIELAKKSGCALGLRANGLDGLAALAEKCAAASVEDLLLDPRPSGLQEAIRDQTAIRRRAIQDHFRPLGYPTLAFAGGPDPFAAALEASVLVSKYASLVVADFAAAEFLFPLLTARQNIYTNPQKPIQVEPKLYRIGEAGRESPVLITTNFSLTYFTVTAEMEASKVPAYLLCVDTEGTSVLTAWAADKFNADRINKAVQAAGLADLVGHRTMVLPGYVAVLSGKVEDESGWKVLVGPKEASGIPKFLKTTYKTLAGS
jgi:acetyl-CoA decarbonylase/synthase complex subunit gamma